MLEKYYYWEKKKRSEKFLILFFLEYNFLTVTRNTQFSEYLSFIICFIFSAFYLREKNPHSIHIHYEWEKQTKKKNYQDRCHDCRSTFVVCILSWLKKKVQVRNCMLGKRNSLCSWLLAKFFLINGNEKGNFFFHAVMQLSNIY